MRDVYEVCPVFESSRFLLRPIAQTDCADLLVVYSDEKAVPLFNSDNCQGDDFHYTTMERMRTALDFWRYSYEQRYFVRWTIVDKTLEKGIGTIELFNRQAEDYFTDCGLLRLDLRSDYEHSKEIREILELILQQGYELFDCSMIATKAVPKAEERRQVLEQMGFVAREEKLIGHDGTQYGDYFALCKSEK